MGLTWSRKRAPLTWWRGDHGVYVRCSKGHVSTVQHLVLPDGTLVAPPEKMSSMHCGHCDEELPLKLDGWAENYARRE